MEAGIYPFFFVFLPICVQFYNSFLKRKVHSSVLISLCFNLFINSLKENHSNIGMGTRCSGQDSNQVPLEWNSVALPLEPICSVQADKGILLGQQKIFKIQIQACAHYVLYVFMRPSRWLRSAHLGTDGTSWRYVSECLQANTGTALSQSPTTVHSFITYAINSTERSPSLEAKVAQLIKTCPTFARPKIPLPCSQQSELSWAKWIQSTHYGLLL